MSSFPTVEKAALAVRDLVQNGIDLACIELVDEQMIKCMNKAGGPITWPESPALFLKFTGRQESMQDDIKRTSKQQTCHAPAALYEADWLALAFFCCSQRRLRRRTLAAGSPSRGMTRRPRRFGTRARWRCGPCSSTSPELGKPTRSQSS